MSEHDIARDALRAAISQGNVAPKSLSDRQEVMGGFGTITVVGAARGILDQLWSEAHRLEGLWTRFDDSSDIQRLNWSEGAPTEVDPSTVALIEQMKLASAVTSGDFDPTLLPRLVELGYSASLNDPKRVTVLPASARAPGNLAGVNVSGTSVTLPLGTTLDAGGIGKGFSGDLLCQMAIDLGALGVMVEMLGDIVVAGSAPDGVAWRLAIESPFDSEQQVEVIRLSRGAIVTSSQRKRRFAEGSEHHLLNARAGRSALTPVQSATVIAGSGAHAEALTKSAFVREPEAWLAWIPDQAAAGMVILDDATVHHSANWGMYA